MRALIASLLLAATAPASLAHAVPVATHTGKLDTTPRTLVMTAFDPEWNALAPAIRAPHAYSVNGMTFLAGTLEGKPVLLMRSGVSVVNAAMNTQLALDRFTVKRIVFSGIAGGVDPHLSIGDVIVPDDWGQYLEVSFARKDGEGWRPPEAIDPAAPANWQFMFPRGVRVGNAAEAPKTHYTIAMDPALLALARKVAPTVHMTRCVDGAANARADSALCLPHDPQVVVGGTGVTAGVYADNAQFREYLYTAWHARVLDMESASVAQVAYANAVPAIVFRSLSDLAGGDADRNMENTFEHLASANSAKVVRAFVAALPN